MQMKKMDKLLRELQDSKRIKTCAQRFGVTGDETRLKICYLLCHYPELSVSQIANILKAPISTISHSLRKLQAIHVVENRRQAKQIFYCLCQNEFAHVLKSQLLAL